MGDTYTPKRVMGGSFKGRRPVAYKTWKDAVRRVVADLL